VPGGTQLQRLQQTLHILLHIWFFQLLPQRTTQLDGQSAPSIDPSAENNVGGVPVCDPGMQS